MRKRSKTEEAANRRLNKFIKSCNDGCSAVDDQMRTEKAQEESPTHFKWKKEWNVERFEDVT